MTGVDHLLKGHRFVPIVVIHDVEHTAPLCEALLEGGVQVVEITLRSEAALPCITEASKRFPDMIIGAGTILTEDQLKASKDSGAHFGVCPGASPDLLEAAERHALPFLPGAVTPSEAMANADAGYSLQKFFPAEASGGTTTLKQMHGPFPDLTFCATGGINPENFLSYLALPNVAAVGGTWLVTPERLEAGDWTGISRDAKKISDALN